MKKNIGVIAAAFLAAAALTACGGSKPAETTAAAETSAEAAETSAAEAGDRSDSGHHCPDHSGNWHETGKKERQTNPVRI